MSFVKTHIPCSKCGSSDAASMNDDGSVYCFSCSSLTPSQEADEGFVKFLEKVKPKSKGNMEKLHKLFNDNESAPVADRRLTRATLERYGVVKDDDNFYFPYYDVDGSLVASKVRNIAEKKFHSEGEWGKAVLFGQQLYSSAGKYVTITEGEFDALAAFQATGSKWPCVSIKNGAANALKDCKAAYEWLNSFDTIVICFDNDEPGKKAAKEVAELFGNKAKVFKHDPEMKDACDYTAGNKEALFVQRWWAAEAFVPDGIVAGNTLWDLVSTPPEPAQCMYPWDGLNALTYGIRHGELVTITAGSGLGKSQLLREIVWHLLGNTNDNIGLMFMEEGIRKTGLSFMSLAANKPLHLPDTESNEEERKDAFERTLGTGRLYLFNHFGSNSIDTIINRVRYMAKALNCKYIALDHISLIVSSQENGDERKAIDELMTKLRMVVQETSISLFAISHLKRPDSGRGHEEGAMTSLAQLRGSGSIAQLSDMVLGLERNGQAEDLNERNTTRVRVMKNRYNGDCGPACCLLYNKHTGRMLEVEDIEEDDNVL
jgi:twinkle protein